MIESAAEPTGLRARRRVHTHRELARHARRLTIERGLSGYTIEELCDIVGVSRRTFFNYFASKEDAVVGHDFDQIDPEALEAFVEARPAGGEGISATLFDDLAHLAIVAIDPDDDEFGDPRALIEREPQLLPRFIGAGEDIERRIAELVARREHLDPSDPAARLAAVFMGALIRTAAEQYLLPSNIEPFAELLAGSVAAAKRLFTAAPCESACPASSAQTPLRTCADISNPADTPTPARPATTGSTR